MPKYKTSEPVNEDRKCPYCDFIIKQGWTERTYEGFTIWFDENMRFAHRHNHENWAAAQKKFDRAPQQRVKREPEPRGRLGVALKDAFEHPEDTGKSEKARLEMLMALTKVIEKGDSSSVRAAEVAGSIVGEMFKAMSPPGPGETCRLCGRTDKPPKIVISREMAESEWQD